MTMVTDKHHMVLIILKIQANTLGRKIPTIQDQEQEEDRNMEKQTRNIINRQIVLRLYKEL
jgi:hypothetical protein